VFELKLITPTKHLIHVYLKHKCAFKPKKNDRNMHQSHLICMGNLFVFVQKVQNTILRLHTHTFMTLYTNKTEQKSHDFRQLKPSLGYTSSNVFCVKFSSV